MPPKLTSSDFRFALPQSLIQVLWRLHEAGHRVVVVGGAPRDYLRGETVNDYDLASDALPQRVQKLFRRCRATGLKHGTVTILLGGAAYEITTFRNDGTYKDSRHPERVEFTGDLDGDLQRRDFSINALAFEPDPEALQTLASRDASNSAKRQHSEMCPSPAAGFSEVPGTLHDPCGGRNDLERRQIRAIGCAAQRFEEDALRMLRACRFSAKLGFAIGNETLTAMAQLQHKLARVSRPRVQEELRRLLCAPFALRGLDYLRGSGLWAQVFTPSFPASLWQGAGLRRLQQVWPRYRALVGGVAESQPEDTGKGTGDCWAAQLLEQIARQNLQNEPLLRWQLPPFSFAWALLQLCLLQAQGAAAESAIPTAKLWQISRQNLDALLFSNREKSGALGLISHADLIWGPQLLRQFATASGARAEILCRRLLAALGSEYSLCGLLLLGLSSQCQAERTAEENFASPDDEAKQEEAKQKPDALVREPLWREFCSTLLRVLAARPPLSIKQLAVDGKVLARDCGVAPGPKMGQLLQELLQHVLKHPEDNQAEALKVLAIKFNVGHKHNET